VTASLILTETRVLAGLEVYLFPERRQLEVDTRRILLPDDVHLGCRGFESSPSSYPPSTRIEGNEIFLKSGRVRDKFQKKIKLRNHTLVSTLEMN
jgi:hypothetical protein